ncbi:protein of unknown function [Pseudomonas sp. JV551A1]|uniref:Uncharacterized protein n=1 Tax=Pseudomonas inefficax TaxID=2078786 RepID=A0AAQ1PCL2_9PSED|nr:hypothetical protein [Pseudomonas]SPO56626.1 protein of unknown function [Pseudomonas sp. JV551A1]SPO62778.1 protein of unknown function [Pseudomonas inefficax]
MTDQNHCQAVNYFYVWEGKEQEGGIEIPGEILKHTDIARSRVLRAVAEEFSKLGKVVVYQGNVVPSGPARHYDRKKSVDLSVQIDGSEPLELSIFDAGAIVQLLTDKER